MMAEQSADGHARRSAEAWRAAGQPARSKPPPAAESPGASRREPKSSRILPGLTPAELRHTAASLAIASGASIKAVQAMLGHSSATLTLDRHGHLFGDELDTVADRLDAARADWRRTSGLSGSGTAADPDSRHTA